MDWASLPSLSRLGVLPEVLLIINSSTACWVISFCSRIVNAVNQPFCPCVCNHLYLYVEVGRIKRARGNEPGFSSPGVFGHELARAFHQEVTIPKCRHIIFIFLPLQLQGWCWKQGRRSSFIYKQTNKTEQTREQRLCRSGDRACALLSVSGFTSGAREYGRIKVFLLKRF